VLTKVDHIEVDDKILANAEIIVVPSHTNIGADGLLGNSFLRFFNFTIDYEKQLLIWNPPINIDHTGELYYGNEC
jgi:hypothetical protein